MCHLYHFSFPSCAHISPLSPLPCLLLDSTLGPAHTPTAPPSIASTPSTITAPPSLTSSPSTITTLTTLRPPTHRPWNHPAHLNTPTPHTGRLHAPTAPTNNFRAPMPFPNNIPPATHATSSHDLGSPGYPCPLCASRQRDRGEGGEVERLVETGRVGVKKAVVTEKERGEEGKDGAEKGPSEGKVERWLQEEEEAGPCGVRDAVGAPREGTQENQASERVEAGVELGRGVRGGGMRAGRGAGAGFGFGAGRMQRQRARTGLWAQRAGGREERGGRWRRGEVTGFEVERGR
ncbi:hypothetical protein MMC27_000390 [Xylographa pallens]|nr:hypothetical protein [Xylographa pallens]